MASLTRVVLLDPGDAVIGHIPGFLGQHDVLQVGSVEAHGEPAIRAILNMRLLSNN